MRKHLKRLNPCKAPSCSLSTMLRTTLGYSRLRETGQEQATVSGGRFFVFLAGRTNDAHLEFVAKLKSIGHTEVNSPEESDYLLVFCPVASRVGTDVSEALVKCPGGKPTILVVMHHTFNTDQVVADSRRLVNNPNVELTVDCLFHEGRILKCSRNNDAWLDVLNYLGVPAFKDLIQQNGKKLYNLPRDHWKLVFFCVVLGLVYIGYIGSGNKDQEKATVSFEKFFVILAGETHGAHLAFVGKLKGIGQTEVESSGESDYLLVFCPVTSQVEADISEALEKLPGGKPTILVVMHHTFNPDQVVAESRRLVDNPNVYRTDCLLQEDKLLKCNGIDVAQFDMQTFLGFSSSQDSGTIGTVIAFEEKNK